LGKNGEGEWEKRTLGFKPPLIGLKIGVS